MGFRTRADHDAVALFPAVGEPILADIPRIPNLLDLISRPWRFRRNEIRSRPPLFAAQPPDRPPGDAGTRRFSVIKTHLCRRRPSHLSPSAAHAGAGGARSWAISRKMSLNICRGTATSAIWNVT
jgi:hypothetical protein